MYETDGGPGRGLDPETRRRIRELFEGQTCSACGAAAARLSGERFYCPDHFPRRPVDRSRQPRVYHCSVAVRA